MKATITHTFSLQLLVASNITIEAGRLTLVALRPAPVQGLVEELGHLLSLQSVFMGQALWIGTARGIFGHAGG
jgi:hypothetical protein